MKLDGQFTEVEFADGVVTFTFSGTLLDSSHPDRMGTAPIDLPIQVENLRVVSRSAICMDHNNRRNFSFKDEPGDARACYRRIRELVAAVAIKSVDFEGLKLNRLEAEGLHFYGMEQVRGTPQPAQARRVN